MKEILDFGNLVSESTDENFEVLHDLENVRQLILAAKYPSFLCQTNETNPNYLEIIEVNQHLTEITGFTKEELIGEDYSFLFEQDTDNNSKDSQSYANLIKSVKNFETCTVNLAINAKNFDQKEARFKVTYNPIKGKTNKLSVFTFEKFHDSQIKEPADNHKSSIKHLEKIIANEKLLREISCLMIVDDTISNISSQIAKKLREYFKADRCIIHDYKDSKTTFIVEDCNIYSQPFLQNNEEGLEDLTKYINFQNHFYSRFKKDENNLISLSHDNIGDISFKPIQDICQKYAIASQITSTITFNGHVNGGIYLHFSEKCDWSVDEIELLELVSDHYSIAIDRWFSIEKVMLVNKELIEKTLELKESLKKEKKLRQMQSEFVAMVSHEFKTPLQLIDSTRELIVRKIKSLGINDESLDKYSAKIQNGILRVNSLIQSTLNLSKIEMSEGKIAAEKNNFDLKSFLHDIVEKNSNLSTQKNLEIIFDIESLPTMFYGDQKMLDHSITNIITNAFKYSKENTEVKISGKIDENNNVEISVIDHGIGIPKEDLEKIGQKFFRASNTLSVAGTGIGIYLTKYFVELHEGSVLIESEANVGTTVKVMLPIKTNL